jgi:hypothetical protein
MNEQKTTSAGEVSVGQGGREMAHRNATQRKYYNKGAPLCLALFSVKLQILTLFPLLGFDMKAEFWALLHCSVFIYPCSYGRVILGL